MKIQKFSKPPQTAEELINASWIPHDTASKHILHIIRKQAIDANSAIDCVKALNRIVAITNSIGNEAPHREFGIIVDKEIL